MLRITAGDSQEAWEKINELFLLDPNSILVNGGNYAANELIAYNAFIEIKEGKIDENFNFNDLFGYKLMKWTSLVGNYISMNELDVVRSRIHVRESKKQNKYTETMKFTNKHGHGKGCLNSITFHKRNKELYPYLCVNIRASEITKRLIFDLLLVQRIGEYIYGEDSHFSVEIFCPNMYMVIESGIMYHSHKNLKKLHKKSKTLVPHKFTDLCLAKLKTYLKIDVNTVSYKVHQRTIKQLQRIDGVPISGSTPIIAKNLKLPNQ